MDSKKALEILLQNIACKNDLGKPENRWILHSIYVGLAARRIAHELSLDEDYALTIGYMHDIGRSIKHNGHPIEGYLYLLNMGYPDIARYSITHSFINNVIFSTAGGGPKDLESFNFIKKYLDSIEINIYDNIVQLCDLFCLETGFTTFEKRILDISQRKGVFSNSLEHFNNIMYLKDKIEKMMGKEIYSLFPEIKKEDLENCEFDREKLIKLFENEEKTKKKVLI